MDGAILLPPPAAILDIGPDVACLGDFDVTVLRGYLGGLTISNDGGAPNTVLDIAQGVCTSDDGVVYMPLPAFTKNCNAAWAVGSSLGALDSGSSLSASTWYHVFVIQRLDTGVTDVLVSQSATAPTMPTNYTKKRRIGSFKTDGSSHILAFTQNGDEFLWVTTTVDVNGITTTTAQQPHAINVPLGIVVNALGRSLFQAGSGTTLVLTSPGVTGDLASTAGNADLVINGASQFAAGSFNIRTNTSQQITTSNSVSGTGAWYWVTKGWIDTRGRYS